MNQHFFNKMNGGLKQKNTGITSWQAVYNMINVPGALLNVITCSSLKGFIFKLTIPSNPEYSEFLGINSNKKAMNTPVYSLVLKFAIITPNGDDLLPSLDLNGEKHDKATESLIDFQREAINQQQIYIDTLSPLGKPITISVVDFSYFNSDACKLLLRKLMTLPSDTPAFHTKKQVVLDFFK